ncbi:ParB family protein [Uliginosibacterium gangwonense]|uniref:ParB family protein n=1 Tax=Uliginosibacterium gangwonense TaxID=392736 RepID=UPI00037F8039|nr:ParB family protein [Uliginosibacterium gangwonense]
MSDTVYVPKSKSLPEVAKNLEQKGKLPRPGLRVKGQIDIGASLHVSAGGTEHGGIRKGDDLDGATMELDIFDQMQPYDHNPRKAINSKYQEIKAAISSGRGIDGTLTVTRRPGETLYIPFRGQNTRYAILRELWEETKDPCFRKVKVVFKQWKSESSTLFSHIAENALRDDVSWFDKATSIINFRSMREKELGRSLSAADMEKETKSEGMAVVRRTIALYDYGVTHLSELGPWLTKENVTTLRNHQTTLENLASIAAKRAEFTDIYLPKAAEKYAELSFELREASQNDEDETKKASVLRGALLDKLIQQLTTAFAEALSLAPNVVEQLLAAGASASAAELQNIMSGVQEAPRVLETRKEESSLASVSGKEENPVVTEPPQPQNAGTNQGNATKAENRGQPQKRAPVQQSQEPIAPVTDLDSAAARFEAVINRFCDLTFTRRWLCTDPYLGLPYVFWLDLPVELLNGECSSMLDLGDEEGNPLSTEATQLRASAFRMLAYFSGQLGGVVGDTERDFAELLPEDSLWRKAVLVDSMSPESFIVRWQNQFLGSVDSHEAVCLRPNRDDFRDLLINPVTGQAWADFIDAFRVWDKHTWSANQK